MCMCRSSLYFSKYDPSPNGKWRQNIGGRELRRENFVQIFARRSWSAYTGKHWPHLYIRMYIFVFRRHMYVDVKIIVELRLQSE